MLLPRSPEQIAAKKHNTAANTKAIVKADMNGPEMALGKKACPCSTLTVFSGIVETMVGPIA